MKEETLAKIASLKTEHPGGYEDIVTALRSANRDIKLPNGIPVHTGDIIEEIGRSVETSLNTASGIIAGAIHHTLTRYKLPSPGHKDWTKPAASWFK